MRSRINSALNEFIGFSNAAAFAPFTFMVTFQSVYAAIENANADRTLRNRVGSPTGARWETRLGGLKLRNNDEPWSTNNIYDQFTTTTVDEIINVKATWKAKR